MNGLLSSSMNFRVVMAMLVAGSTCCAQETPPPGRRAAVQAIERFLQTSGQEAIDQFVADHFADEAGDAEELKNRLQALREKARGKGGEVTVQPIPGGFRLNLSGATGSLSLDVGLDENGIRSVTEAEIAEGQNPSASIVLDRENLEGEFAKLEAAGISGVVRIKTGGKVIFSKAFGTVARGSKNPLRPDTMFCIGSTPIDFTVAAILLLEADGKLSLEDPVSKYFPDTPADKQGMTIYHLLTGQSGLPDFHHLESDQDRDLSWIDRAEAERRILSQTLLFEPGADRAHSHSAFGLLAALIERISGQSYIEFLRARIFEPAGMTRTGLYEDFAKHSPDEFAAGGGPDFVGDPNVPPHWGPTSWLVMGSGGMVSTIEDLDRFFDFARSSGNERLVRRFTGKGIGTGGSDRGFHVAHIFSGAHDEVLLLVNSGGHVPEVRAMTRALERFILGDE